MVCTGMVITLHCRPCAVSPAGRGQFTLPFGHLGCLGGAEQTFPEGVRGRTWIRTRVLLGPFAVVGEEVLVQFHVHLVDGLEAPDECQRKVFRRTRCFPVRNTDPGDDLVGEIPGR